eukprot:scaffold191185_cov15-Prasinocladus_malaysianus.AAC.1
MFDSQSTNADHSSSSTLHGARKIDRLRAKLFRDDGFMLCSVEAPQKSAISTQFSSDVNQAVLRQQKLRWISLQSTSTRTYDFAEVRQQQHHALRITSTRNRTSGIRTRTVLQSARNRTSTGT